MTTRYTIKVDTTNARVEIGTTSYTGGISNVGLFVTSNTIVGNLSNKNAIVLYATGTVIAAGPLVISGSSFTFSVAGIPSGPSTPMVKSTSTAAQSIGNNANQQLYFNFDIYDRQNIHDVTGSSSSFVVPALADGLYHGNCSVAWAASALGVRGVGFFKNGVAMVPEYVQQAAGSAVTIGQQASFEDNLVAGDVIKCYGFQTSGGGLNASAGSGFTMSKTW